MTTPNLRPGEIVDGRFTLKRRLGAGSSGVVWSADDPVRGEAVALKILHPQFAHETALIEQLAREADLLMRMDHPNLARAFAFQDRGPLVFLAMELLDGRSLDQEIGEHTRAGTFFRHRVLARVVDQICAGMEYAHAQGIVHRDLKPQNVMVRARHDLLDAKVLDFGIARLSEVSLFEATTLGRRLGSMFYMAPEQTRGEPADARSDVFALGCILFELLTLRRAWAWDEDGAPLPAFDTPIAHSPANAVAAVFTRISGPTRPRPRAVRPELPAIFDRIVRRALAVDPDDRYPDVTAFAAEARDALLVLTGLVPAADALTANPSDLISGASEAVATVAMEDGLADALGRGDSAVTDRRAAPTADAPQALDGPLGLPREGLAVAPTLALEGVEAQGPHEAPQLASPPSLALPRADSAAATIAPEPALTRAMPTADAEIAEGPPTRELPSAPRPDDPTNFLPTADGPGFADVLTPAGPTAADPAPTAPTARPAPPTATAPRPATEPAAPVPKRLLVGLAAGGLGLFAGVVALVLQTNPDDAMPPMAPAPKTVVAPAGLEATAPRHPELLALLQRVRKAPEDDAAMKALVAGILDAAEGLPDAHRDEIRQIATLSSTVRNVDGLARCIAQLEAAAE